MKARREGPWRPPEAPARNFATEAAEATETTETTEATEPKRSLFMNHDLPKSSTPPTRPTRTAGPALSQHTAGKGKPRSSAFVASLLAIFGLCAVNPAITAKASATGAAAAAKTAVKVENTTFKSVDAIIAGQWEFPATTPAPLVVLIPASGGVDRNGLPPDFADEPEIGIYYQLAKKLLAAGFAVFRYDSPGTGRSSRGNFSTERSTALEGYTRAVDHARVDTDHVFLFGHSGGTDTVVGIYPRYEQVAVPAGVILLANQVGETEITRVKAPLLILVSKKDPRNEYEKGRFLVDARAKFKDAKLETELVTLPQAAPGLVKEVPDPEGGHFEIEPDAVDAMLRWLRRHSQVAERS